MAGPPYAPICLPESMDRCETEPEGGSEDETRLRELVSRMDEEMEGEDASTEDDFLAEGAEDEGAKEIDIQAEVGFGLSGGGL